MTSRRGLPKRREGVNLNAMGSGRKFLPAVIVGGFFLGLACVSARGDLVISGFHGIRIYDERTGRFLKNIGLGEEQEGIAFAPDGRLFGLVNDMGGGWISQYAPETYAWNGGFGSHDITAMPSGMTFGPDGNLYAAGTAGFGMPGGVQRLDGSTGADLGVFVTQGTGGLTYAYDIVFGPDGNLYVSNWGDSKVLRFDGKSGAYIDDFVPSGSGGLEGTTGITFGLDGNLYVSSETTGRVLRYQGGSGQFMGEFVAAGLGGLARPAGLVFGPDGHLYVCSRGNHAVLRFDENSGEFIDVFVPPGAGGLDNGPNYIAFTPRLPQITICNTEEATVVSWTQTTYAYDLETSASLDGPWEVFTNSIATGSPQLIKRESDRPEQQRFFRLRRKPN